MTFNEKCTKLFVHKYGEQLSSWLVLCDDVQPVQQKAEEGGENMDSFIFFSNIFELLSQEHMIVSL